MSESDHVLPKHMGGGPHGLGKYWKNPHSMTKCIIINFLVRACRRPGQQVSASG